MLLVVASSAALRLSQARVACPEWPTCRLVQGPVAQRVAAAALPAAAETAVRGLHRASASLALLVIIVMLIRCRALSSDCEPVLKRSLWGLLALAIGLSALGIAVPGARQGLPMLGNLLGGLSMLALAWTLVRRLAGPRSCTPQVRRRARWAALAWLAQAASGAWSGAAGVGAGSVAPILHLLLAVLAFALAFWLVLSLRTAGLGSEGRVLLALLGMQALLGTWALIASPTLAVVLLHNLSAAVGLAWIAGRALSDVTPSREVSGMALPVREPA
ncbi:MAG: hypothetical protein JNJ71_00860 [Rubrivivax sp.]|nr:hypothetical protein [Rubrivivax sp.]